MEKEQRAAISLIQTRRATKGNKKEYDPEDEISDEEDDTEI